MDSLITLILVIEISSYQFFFSYDSLFNKQLYWPPCTCTWYALQSICSVHVMQYIVYVYIIYIYIYNCMLRPYSRLSKA